MFELNTTEFASVVPLLAGIKQKVLPYAICEGVNPGRILVDKRRNPQTALIWSPVGYYFLAGNPDQAKNVMDIGQTLTEIFVPASQARGETGFILIPSDGGWKKYLPELLPERNAIEIYRRPFTLDPIQFASQGDWRERIPKGFQLRLVDASLAEKVGVLASWRSIDDFLANGLGFVLLAGDEIASACISVFASHESIEIDVHTDEKYRRRGFSTLVASALIEECLKRGKQPNWECFWENEPSCALATHLGFRAEPDFPVFFWEE
jgi:RimJ/RimL family protein N-acetyltransferase